MRDEVIDEPGLVAYPSPIERVDANLSIPGAFRNAMRNLASGVNVVTVGSGSDASGFTATSVVSLSVDPPTILVSLNRSSTNWPLVRRSGHFAVNMLSSSHLEIAETFAGRRGLEGRDRYVDARWQHGPGHAAHLSDALSVIDCVLEEAVERYSHAILIGRVVGAVFNTVKRPLVYWQGGYNELPWSPNPST